jgi:hypothetical protein
MPLAGALHPQQQFIPQRRLAMAVDNKTKCYLLVHEPPGFCLKKAHRNWSGHPSWIGAMEALDDYHRWVSQVVMPIAFQWIEEHRDEVYSSVKDPEKNDVGVVIASAFKLVKKMPAYKEGLKNAKPFNKAVKDGTFNSKIHNPVWTKIVKKVRIETKKAFAEETPPL